ncbi:unnamed protein product [Anisakis simplex]|uniref:Nucleolar complex protein 3 homolog (inferred by orthology to a C. elegans protein) n=1 Tax=Anisakis simplex TaxID=6269 RepID=A0A0M3J5M6_ANISI|nr:unnamed protein product [Anisakis simplex]
MILLLKSLHLMINHRRKQVILCRVAAFVKRLLHISFLLPTNYTIAILCAIRTFFISHPRLNSMLECDDDDRSVVNKSSALDVFIPEVNDPDCCNALSTSIILETDLLSKHPNAIISQLAKNIRAGCPSSGANRVSADLSNCKPNEIIEKCPNGMVSNSHPYFSGQEQQSTYFEEFTVRDM